MDNIRIITKLPNIFKTFKHEINKERQIINNLRHVDDIVLITDESMKMDQLMTELKEKSQKMVNHEHARNKINEKNISK